MKILFTIIIFLINTFAAFSQDLFVKRTMTHDLESLDFYKNYRLNNSIYRYESEQESLTNIKVSSNEDMVAFIEIGNATYFTYGISILKILHQSGETLHVEDSVLDYDWSPDGTKIILTKGINRIERFSDPKELILLDIQGKKSIKYFNLKHYYPIKLNWVGDHVYFRSNDTKSSFKVIKFNVKENSFAKTKLPSTSISPDEQYVAVSEYESSQYLNCDSNKKENLSCFKIYDIAANTYLDFFSKISLGEPGDWVFSSDHYFLFKKMDENGNLVNYMYDVSNNELIKSFESKMNPKIFLDSNEELYFFEK